MPQPGCTRSASSPPGRRAHRRARSGWCPRSRVGWGAQADEREQHAAAGDRDVGDVEDGPPLRVDEVDDATAEEPVTAADETVDDVADGAPEDEPERDRSGLGVD